MKVDLNKINELLHNSNLSEVARAVGIPYRTLQAWKRSENKWWTDTQDKLTKLQNHVNVEELKMKKEQLTVNNLYFSHYEDGLHTLEFEVNGKKVFVRNIDVDVKGDEDYWDDTENVKKAVDEADENDIEEVTEQGLAKYEYGGIKMENKGAFAIDIALRYNDFIQAGIFTKGFEVLEDSCLVLMISKEKYVKLLGKYIHLVTVYEDLETIQDGDDVILRVKRGKGIRADIFTINRIA